MRPGGNRVGRAAAGSVPCATIDSMIRMYVVRRANVTRRSGSSTNHSRWLLAIEWARAHSTVAIARVCQAAATSVRTSATVVNRKPGPLEIRAAALDGKEGGDGIENGGHASEAVAGIVEAQKARREHDDDHHNKKS